MRSEKRAARSNTEADLMDEGELPKRMAHPGFTQKSSLIDFAISAEIKIAP